MPHIYEQQEHSRPYGMHSWMLLAVLLDFILPLSGLLYDDHYVKNDPGWYVGWVSRDFCFGRGQLST